MFNIAICDDETEQLDIMERFIHENMVQSRFLYQVIRFNVGKDLIEGARKEKISAVFLDIDMPEMTGIEVARELLKENRDIRIFFISNHEEMVFEAIHTRPMRFIRKNNLINEMTEAILFLKKELEKTNY